MEVEGSANLIKRHAIRSQSFQSPRPTTSNTVGEPPPLPPRPRSGERRHSLPTCQEDEHGALPPPPIPESPRPFIPGFSDAKPPAIDPPPSSPSSSSSASSSRARHSRPLPQPGGAAAQEKPKLSTNPTSFSTLTSDQIQQRIEMQTNNTEELLQALVGHEDDKLTPLQLVARFGQYFPFRGSVEKGFYSNRAEIVAGEIYNIHFLKKARVATIIDSVGEKFILPLNAAMKLGFEQNGHPLMYKGVTDIANAAKLPRLVCSMGSYASNDKKVLLRKDEVLVVKEALTSRVLRSKSLVVLSLDCMEEKRLSADCRVDFSTDPIYTQVTLTDIVNHCPDLIPGTAKLCPTADVEDLGFPAHLISETVQVKRHFVEHSLITTLKLEEQEGYNKPKYDPFKQEDDSSLSTIYDIPLSLDIEFSILPPTQDEDIYQHTGQIYAAFDPRKLTSGDGTGLNMAIDENHMYEGVDIELPPYINLNPNDPTVIFPDAVSAPYMRVDPKTMKSVPLLEPELPQPVPLCQPLPVLPPKGRHASKEGGNKEEQDEYSEIDFTPKPQATENQDDYIEVDSAFSPPPPPTLPPHAAQLSKTHPAGRKFPPLPPLPLLAASPPPPPLPGNHPSFRHLSSTDTPSPVASPRNPRRVGGATATPTAALPSTPAATTAAANTATATSSPAPTTAVPSSDHRKGSNTESTVATQGSDLQAQIAFRPLPSIPTHSMDSALSSQASGGAGGAGVDLAMIDANRRGGVVSPAESTESYEDTADFLGSRKQLSPEPSESLRLSGSEEYKLVQQLTDLMHMIQILRDQLPVKARQQQMTPSRSNTDGAGKILHDELKQMKEELEKVWNYPQEIISYCRSTEAEMSMMRSQLNDLLLRTSTNALVDENRNFLASMDIVQVTKLLELLNMVQYQDKFVQECIDGGILLELNEGTLEKELGITGRLERMRLMRIIRGERSAKSILDGEYNYVAMERK